MKEIDVENSVIFSNSKLDIGNIVSNEYIGGIRFEPIKCRGFEVVSDKNRKHPNVDIELPVRGDSGSAGYDIRIPKGITLQPNEKKLIWTDIKAYMQPNEVLELYVRSSIGIKKGIILSNITPIIDASYYNCEGTEGNIGLSLWNTSDKVVELEANERVCQGIFKNYLIVDNDVCLKKARTGGIGSSNE